MAKIGTLRVSMTSDNAGLESGLSRAQASLKAFEQSATAMQRRFKRTGKRMSRIGRNMARNISLPAGVASGLAVKAFADFESAMTEVQKVSSKGIADEMSEEIRDMAQTIPLSQTRLADLAAQAARFGIEGSENIRKFTETVGKMSFATDLSADEAGIALAKLTTITDATQGEIEHLGSAINSLGNNFATSQKEITESTLRAGAAATQFGLTAEEAVAFSASINEVSESSSRAGTRLRRVFQELAEPDKLAKAAEAIGMTASAFRKLKKESPREAIMRVVEAFDVSTQKGKELQSTFSTASRQALAGLRQNFEGLQEALNVSNDQMEKGTSLQREFDLVTQDLNAQFTILWNKVKEVGISFGKALLPTVKSLIENLEGLMEWMNSLSDSTKVLVGQVAAFVTVAGPVTALTGAMITGISGWSSAMTVAAAAANKLKRAQVALTAALRANPIAAVAMVIGAGLTTSLMNYFTATKKATDQTKDYGEAVRWVQDLTDKHRKKLVDEMSTLDQLIGTIDSAAEGTRRRADAIESLEKNYGKYIDSLRTEEGTLKDLSVIRSKILDQMREEIVLQSRQQQLKNALSRQAEELTDSYDHFKGVIDEFNLSFSDYQKMVEKGAQLTDKQIGKMLGFSDEVVNAKERLVELRHERVRQNKELQHMDQAHKQEVERLRELVKGYQGAITEFRTTSSAIDVASKEAERLRDLIDSLSKNMEEGSDNTKDQRKEFEKLAKAARISSKEVAGMVSSMADADEPQDWLQPGWEDRVAIREKKLKEWRDSAKKVGDDMVKIGRKLDGAMAKMGETIASEFGKAIAGVQSGTEAMQSIFRGLGSILQRLGSQMLSAAITMQSFWAALASKPAVAAAAGAAMIALGAALNASMKDTIESETGVSSGGTPRMAEGGVAFGESLAVVGDNKNARSNPEVIAPLDKLKSIVGDQEHVVYVKGKLDGEDIMISNQRSMATIDRAKGKL